jgi:hypothetical protein
LCPTEAKTDGVEIGSCNYSIDNVRSKAHCVNSEW